MALDKYGNILLIEFKHGSNTSGIYLSPLQIGVYNEIFSSLDPGVLHKAVFDMLHQKQSIGLIHPQWPKPKTIKGIIPWLVISASNNNSTAKARFNEVMNYAKRMFGQNFLATLEKKIYFPPDILINW